LRDDTKKLIALRRGTPALHSRVWLPLTVEPATLLFAYLRTNDVGEEPVIVLLNFSATEIEAMIELPEAAAEYFQGRELTDLWNGERVSAPTGGQVTIAVSGWGFRVLTNGDDEAGRTRAAGG